MNHIYLIIPALKDDVNKDYSRIHAVQKFSQDEFVELVKNMKQLCQLVAGEYDAEKKNLAMYYSKKVLDKLYNVVKQEPREKKKFEIGNLLLFFNNFTEVEPSADADFNQAHPELEPYADMIHAYLQNPDTSAIANANGLENAGTGLNIDYQGKRVTIQVFDNYSDLYKWFIAHRETKRQYDPNYEKHSQTARLVKKGKVASPITYTQTELEQILDKAVRAGAGHGELYFYDKNKDKYIIFFAEGGDLYHAFEFTEDNNEEMNKIWSRGKRDLDERIKLAANV